MSAATVKPSETFSYYEGTIYWTNFDIFLQSICKTMTGDPTVYWHEYFLRKYGKQQSAFVFSCGNGWVERDLYQKGIIGEVVAFDVMRNYVDEARTAAEKIGLPATYFVADGNTYDPGDLRCDIVVNQGAMHHVAYINRMTALIAKICRGGLYVAHDYTGAHRNQYSWNVWSRVLEVHHALPEKYRVPLRYPHLDTMIRSDPSEAVHSELQVEVLLRHFDVIEFKRLGGGVAHHTLLNNHRLHAEQHTPEGKAALNLIAEAEERSLQEDPDFNLFSFFVARPKTDVASPSQLLTWQAEEDEREARAARDGGRYYPVSALELIYDGFTRA